MPSIWPVNFKVNEANILTYTSEGKKGHNSLFDLYSHLNMKHEHSQSEVEFCNVLKHLLKPSAPKKPPAPNFTYALYVSPSRLSMNFDIFTSSKCEKKK